MCPLVFFEEQSKLASAYTPGLTVSGDIVVRRVRRLPIKGEVLVRQGEEVHPETVVARSLLPGMLQTVKLAERLGVEAKDVKSAVKVKEGDPVTAGQLVAETKGLFGKLFKGTAVSEYTGVVETISEVSGNMLIREPSIPVDVTAYIQGKVAEVLPGEGAIIEARGAMIQGIFGVGGERTGEIDVIVGGPDQPIHADNIHADMAGKILVGGSGFSFDAIKKAAEIGVTALVAGGVRDRDLKEYLGYEIGVAITGQEPIPLTLMVTEGFGFLNMADRTFELLHSMKGKTASINGATQIRAGVIRPEIIVPLASTSSSAPIQQEGGNLEVGVAIRVIREPYFGQLGTVTELPAELMTLESGTTVRVLKAKLGDGDEVVVPRANVEILAS